ncbi:MAG: hypothetical protein L6R37_006179, partial [Teloschistes peruensis]
MIVNGLYEEHYAAVPIYTHDGTGLANKKAPEEYVSIKDHRSDDKNWEPLYMYPALLTEIINVGIELYNPKSTAHITHAHSIKYTLPVVHEELLRKESINALIELFTTWVQ